MKQSETENLLSLIFQSGGQVQVENERLMVGPVEIAKKFGDQIRRLKPEILLSLGHCPVCARKLVVEIGEDCRGLTGRHSHCEQAGHFDKWSF